MSTPRLDPFSSHALPDMATSVSYTRQTLSRRPLTKTTRADLFLWNTFTHRQVVVDAELPVAIGTRAAFLAVTDVATARALPTTGQRDYSAIAAACTFAE